MTTNTTDAQKRFDCIGPNHETVSLAGGVLVYERRDIGRELVGFVDVSDWDELTEGLAARGHDRGAVFHLPELDQ